MAELASVSIREQADSGSRRSFGNDTLSGQSDTDFDVGRLERIGLAAQHESEQGVDELAPEAAGTRLRQGTTGQAIGSAAGEQLGHGLADIGEAAIMANELGTSTEADLIFAQEAQDQSPLGTLAMEAMGIETPVEAIERRALTDKLQDRLDEQAAEAEAAEERFQESGGADAFDAFIGALEGSAQLEQLIEQTETESGEENDDGKKKKTGNCPNDSDTAADGSRCGGRSAHSRGFTTGYD